MSEGTDRQTERLTDRGTESVERLGKTDRGTESVGRSGQTRGKTDRWTESVGRLGKTDRGTESVRRAGQTDGQSHGKTDRHRDRKCLKAWTDRQIVGRSPGQKVPKGPDGANGELPGPGC